MKEAIHVIFLSKEWRTEEMEWGKWKEKSWRGKEGRFAKILKWLTWNEYSRSCATFFKISLQYNWGNAEQEAFNIVCQCLLAN